MKKNLSIHLKVWRQENTESKGEFVDYDLKDVSPDISFLELLDQLNNQLTKKQERAVEFDSDCREGICGSCGVIINGQAHGPQRKAASCQIYMREFQDGETLVVEPFRAKALPVIRDLVVDRSALDRLVQAGAYTAAKTGPHADANALLVAKSDADYALDAATCIQCGACVAACPNASASLFTGAQITRFALLPQGKLEASSRVSRMVEQMDKEGFGHCSNLGECQAACPKDIPLDVIVKMRQEYFKALASGL